MSEMERGSILQLEQAARGCGMSYGQYVAARFYPVIIVEELPDGGRVVRRAAVPGGAEAETPAEPKHRAEERPQRTERQCVVCGHPLRGSYRKYCSEECREAAAQVSGCHPNGTKRAQRVDRCCDVCGKAMHQVLRSQKYCGPACRKIGNAKKQREWHAANPGEKEPRYCQICGIRIEGKGYKYCPNCVGAAKGEQHRQYRMRKILWENVEF